MQVLPAADDRLSWIAPLPVDRSRSEIRCERFPPAAYQAVAGQVGPLANLRSSSGCGVSFATDSPWVELRLARLRHHQPTPVGIALEVGHDDGWRSTASPDLREHDGDLAVRLATGLERGAAPRPVIAWLPLISTCAVAALAVAEGAALSAWSSPAPSWVVLGDSLSQGFCAQDPTQAWVHRVARRIGRPAWNLGVGGLMIEPAVFAHVLDRRWDAVLIALGSNHAWKESAVASVAERAAALAEAALAAGHGRVAWLLPPWKAFEDGLGPREFAGVPLDAAAADRVARIRAALRETLARCAPRLEVIGDLLPHDLRLLPDGLHPTAAGFARYATNLAAALGW